MNAYGLDSGILSSILSMKIGTSINDNVYAKSMAVNPINHYVALTGIFTSYNGTTANYCCVLRPDGTLDPNFDLTTGFGSYAFCAAYDSQGRLYVGGAFTTYKGATNNRIIRLNADGSKDTGFDNSTGFNSGRVTQILIDENDKVYCVGSFTQYKSVSANRIIRLNDDGSKDTGFDNSTGFNTGEARCMGFKSNGKIYVGGDFTSYKGSTYQRIILLNTDGTIDTSFNTVSGAGNYVIDLAVDSNDRVYIVGGFTSFKGTSGNNYIVGIDTDGSKYTTFDNSTGFNAATGGITIDNEDRLYVVGNFTQYKSVTNNRIISLNLDGSKNTTFDNTTGFDVNVLGVQFNNWTNRILVGTIGTTSTATYKGTTVGGFCPINLNGTLDITA